METTDAGLSREMLEDRWERALYGQKVTRFPSGLLAREPGKRYWRLSNTVHELAMLVLSDDALLDSDSLDALVDDVLADLRERTLAWAAAQEHAAKDSAA